MDRSYSSLVELFPEEPDFHFVTCSMYNPLSPLKRSPRRRRRPAVRPYHSDGQSRPTSNFQQVEQELEGNEHRFPLGWRQREISRLAANPMFDDLQKAVRSECINTPLPVTLLQAPPQRQESLVHKMAAIHGHFLSLQVVIPPRFRQKLNELHQFYKDQTLAIEEERMRSLQEGNPLLYQTINGMFEERQHQLSSRVEVSLAGFCRHLDQGHLDQGHTTIDTNRSISAQALVSTSREQEAAAKVNHREKSAPLNPKAVVVMTRWYRKNRDHPYPGREVIKSIAVRAGVKEEHVLKWFERKRSVDTKSVSGGLSTARHHIGWRQNKL